MTTWNPNDKGQDVTLAAGNLTAINTSSGGGLGSFGFFFGFFSSGNMVRATVGDAPGSGHHWQFEVTINAAAAGFGAGANVGVGLANSAQNLAVQFDGSNGFGYHTDGWFYDSGTPTNTGVPFGNGDVITVEKQGTSGKWYKNGTLVRQIVLPSDTLFPAAIVFTSADSVTASFAGAFAHPVTGATAWVVDPTTLPAIHLTYNKTLPSLFQVATMNTIDPGTGEPTQAPPKGTVGGYFPDAISSVLAGHIVRLDLLVLFDFLSGPMRLWQGFGTLRTNDNHDWQGIGQLGTISDLESAIGGTAPQAKFTLSGVDPTILADALDQQNEIYGRDCNVYMQFFDQDFNCLDFPYVIWAGLMDTIRITQTVEGCQVELSAETIFARRAMPPLGTLSDREQQKFFPGDNSLAGIPSLMAKTAIWPVILPQS